MFFQAEFEAAAAAALAGAEAPEGAGLVALSAMTALGPAPLQQLADVLRTPAANQKNLKELRRRREETCARYHSA